MKWFAHKTDLMEDPKMTSLFDVHGLVGNACYLLMMERIVEQIEDKSTITFPTFTWESWAEFFDLPIQQCREIFHTMEDVGLIKLGGQGENVTITVLDMPEIGDDE